MVITIITLNLLHLRYRNKPDFNEAEIEEKHILIDRGYLDDSVFNLFFSSLHIAFALKMIGDSISKCVAKSL